MDLDAGRTAIFKNEKKTENDKQPHYRGELKTPDGQHLRISLWVDTAKSSGKKYFSGRVEVPQEQAQAQSNGSSGGDELPF